DFAQRFDLPIVPVIDEDGTLIESAQFSSMPAEEGKAALVAWLGERGRAEPAISFRLRDWGFSRQRYWGSPIPIIYCDDHGPVPVPEKDLPVILPMVADTRPDESGAAPLARHEEWYRVPCPTCGKPARRETDVSDTFLDSAWY